MFKKIVYLLGGIALIGFIIVVIINAKVPSKSEAIQSFINNINTFVSIQNYAENESGDLNVDGGIFIVKITNPGGNDEIVDISQLYTRVRIIQYSCKREDFMSRALFI